MTTLRKRIEALEKKQLEDKGYILRVIYTKYDDSEVLCESYVVGQKDTTEYINKKTNKVYARIYGGTGQEKTDILNPETGEVLETREGLIDIREVEKIFGFRS